MIRPSSCIISYTLPYLAYPEYAMSIPAMPCPSWQCHVSPDNAMAPLPTSGYPSRCWAVPQRFWTVSKVFCPILAAHIVSTSVPTTPRLCRPRQVSADDFGRPSTMQAAHKRYRTFCNYPGRSLALQGVL